MSTFKIYHNPRCSKSRQALQILQEAGHEPEVIEYLKTPPTVAELKDLLSKLGFLSAREIMRSKEADYKSHNLADEHNEEKLIAALHEHPRLIERPIVVRDNKAVLGRPPEAVTTLIADTTAK